MIAHAAPERAALAAVLSAMALVVLDAGMVTVSLPTIGRAFAAPPHRALLVVGAHQLALLIGLLPAAHIAERTGARRLFVGGILLFSAAAVGAALAPTLSLLVAARFVQGIGGAAVMALGIALLRDRLGPERLDAAIAWNAALVAVCSAAAPAAGALLLSFAGWRWLFVIALPAAAVALAAAPALPAAKGTGDAVDRVAILLYAAGAACAALAVEARSAPLAALVPAAAALAFASLLLSRDRRKAAPLLPLDLLALRPLRTAASASVFLFTAQSAGMLALAFHVQLSLGRSIATAGFVLASWPVAVAAASRLAHRLAGGGLSSSVLCVAGALLLAVALAAGAAWPAGPSAAPLAVCALVCGAGFGLFQVPNNRTLFLVAPAGRSAAAGGLQGTARLAGQTAGALLVGLVLSSAPIALAPRLALALAALAALAAAWISGRRPALAPHPLPSA